METLKDVEVMSRLDLDITKTGDNRLVQRKITSKSKSILTQKGAETPILHESVYHINL